ncbi:MAG: biopolymer transporter ExbD [Treponema sp.]|jgi:biopolymer transport protein ExbD|nr:biopolymer transporter ExbD [Treponema sp.]
MLIKRKSREGIESSSALSDIAFLLIIYFIVIAGFNVNRGFLMNLPRKDSIKTVPRDELLRFSIDEKGFLFFKEMPLSFDEASAEIRRALAEHPHLSVFLTVDGNAPWQSVVSFVELAQENAVESFSFSLHKPAEDPP